MIHTKCPNPLSLWEHGSETALEESINDTDVPNKCISKTIQMHLFRSSGNGSLLCGLNRPIRSPAPSLLLGWTSRNMRKWVPFSRAPQRLLRVGPHWQHEQRVCKAQRQAFHFRQCGKPVFSTLIHLCTWKCKKKTESSLSNH